MKIFDISDENKKYYEKLLEFNDELGTAYIELTWRYDND